VEAAVDSHGSSAAQLVEEKLRLFAPGRPLPQGEGDEIAESTPANATPAELNVEALLQRLAAALRIAREGLIAADDAHLKELDDDPEPRRRRDAVAAQGYTEVTRLRTVARGLYGSDVAAELLGVDGKTSTDPLLLHRQAVRILQRFTDPETVFPPIEVVGAQLSREEWAEQLGPEVESLGAALDEVHRQHKAAESTLIAKKEAQEEFDRTYQGVARTVEGVFGMAGLKELADRVRPRRRKALRQEVSESDDAGASPEAIASGVVAEPPPQTEESGDSIAPRAAGF